VDHLAGTTVLEEDMKFLFEAIIHLMSGALRFIREPIEHLREDEEHANNETSGEDQIKWPRRY
jgi:hypothetical protein